MKRVFRQFDVPRLCVRAGLLSGIVLLKTLISRIRNLSTEDGFPAWRIAAVPVAQLPPNIVKDGLFTELKT